MDFDHELHAIVREENLDSELRDLVNVFVKIGEKLKAPTMLAKCAYDGTFAVLVEEV